MLLFGLAVVAYPFLSSFSTGPKQENDAWITCDLSTLDAGNTLRCGRAMIYKRTKKDFSHISKFEALLADPKSINSHQPVETTNIWRSENPAYFIYMPWAPIKGCAVTVVRGKTHFNFPVPEQNALDSLSYFTEPCEGRSWDMSGRLYKREGYPTENNLAVPRVKWQSNTLVHVRQNLR